MTLIASDVAFRWPGGADARAVEGFSGEFIPGVPHILCGPSGSGKTTLSLLLAGLMKPERGRITLGNETVYELRRQIAYLFQFPEGIFFEDSVRREMEDWTSPDQLLDLSYFDRLQIPFDQISETHPYHLSAGYGRLVALALQLARQPRLLVVDEPTIGLDWVFHERVTRTLREWVDPQRILIVITHDLELMRELKGQAWVMKDGRLEWLGATGELLANPSLLAQYSLKV